MLRSSRITSGRCCLARLSPSTPSAASSTTATGLALQQRANARTEERVIVDQQDGWSWLETRSLLTSLTSLTSWPRWPHGGWWARAAPRGAAPGRGIDRQLRVEPCGALAHDGQAYLHLGARGESGCVEALAIVPALPVRGRARLAAAPAHGRPGVLTYVGSASRSTNSTGNWASGQRPGVVVALHLQPHLGSALAAEARHGVFGRLPQPRPCVSRVRKLSSNSRTSW